MKRVDLEKKNSISLSCICFEFKLNREFCEQTWFATKIFQFKTQITYSRHIQKKKVDL